MITEELVEEGIVIRSENGFAEVRMNDSEECEECSAKIFCKPDSNNQKILRALDPFQSNPGDSVTVSIAGNMLFKATIFLYGIPLVIIITVIWAGLIFLQGVSNSELISFAASILAAAVYYLIFYIYSKNKKQNLNLVRIISVRRK